jgi:signal transduction histidine kinase
LIQVKKCSARACYQEHSSEDETFVGRARSISIRALLTRVVLAAALPVWLASALLLYEVHADRRALIERDAGATARAVMVAVDRELASAMATAQALAVSPYFLSDDLGAFYVQANVTLPSSAGNVLALSDAAGQQVLNTLRRYGEPLPRHGNPQLVQRVFATGSPEISDVFVGGVQRRPMVSVNVPVFRNGKVIYSLAIGLLPERLGEILYHDDLPAGWVAAIFDSKGVNVARSHGADRFVGQKGVPALVEKMAQMPEGAIEITTLEGVTASALFSRSQVSNWAVAIYVPTTELTGLLWRPLALSLAATVVLIALGLVAAQFTGRRLTQPIQALASLALAHGRGEPVAITPLGLREADDVAGDLFEGSRMLEARTVERDRAERERQHILIAKQLADAAARARSAYFTYLSHELRSPLTAVLGCSDLIATRTRSTSQDEKTLKYCARIGNGVQHVIRIINEVLDYAKFEAQGIELHKEPLDVAEEVRGAVDLLAGTAEQASVELRHEVPPNLPPLFADRIRLRQILLNVVSNALKFTLRGGTVTVSAARGEDAHLVIRVEDTGVGISADDLSRVMQPFAQVLNAQTKEHIGTGLGLPLTKGLVELHGGAFTMASAPGTGTTVTVRLPMRSM